ncbi:MAG: lipoate--protein ligase [Clostridia bacterium]|nr:lipoate--protein ligase [Clostridia bacterium]
MLYFTTDSTDSAFNLAFEQRMFDSMPAGETALGLWRNRSAVIIGRHQDAASEVDAGYLRDNGIALTRRLSGGGAVYHDAGNLNFTYIMDMADQTSERRLDFAFFLRPVLNALNALGVRAELSGRNDLCAEGRKCSGNAQYTRNGRVLHHGTLLFNANLDIMTRALCPPADKLAARGVPSVRARVVNIAELLPVPMTIDDFQARLMEHLRAECLLTAFHPDSGWLSQVEALRRDRYTTYAWNWGESPRYNQRRQVRFAGGGLTAFLWVEGGRLQEAVLRGDFFAEDPEVLEAALTGAVFSREGIMEALAPLGDLSAHIHSLDTETLIRTVLGE